MPGHRKNSRSQPLSAAPANAPVGSAALASSGASPGGTRANGMLDALAYAVVVTALLALAAGKLDIFSPAWLLFLAPLVTGCAAYRLRETRQVGYGMIEITVGVVFAAAAMIPQQPAHLRTAFTFLGCVYIIVRGLDNIGKGLPEPRRGRWARSWRR